MKKQSLKMTRTIEILIVLLFVTGLSSYGQGLSQMYNQNVFTRGEYVSEKVDVLLNNNLRVIRDGSVTITEMVDQYLFPSSINEAGDQVVIQTFGSSTESFYWTPSGGLLLFPGKGTDVASNGTIVGDFINEDFPAGGTVNSAGTWDVMSHNWTFLGMNPGYPDTSSGEYNSAWGQSNDGSAIVGMQWHDGWSVTAFKWTESEGYNMIGSDLPYDSRASGISGNGEVVFS